jgi:hypothetical protein
MPDTKRRSNSSATDSVTMKRFAAMHDWPLLMVRAFTAVRAAAVISALGITMNGSLPPSSSTVFLICLPAALATWLPAPVLPVRVAAVTRESSMTRRTRSVSISSVWKQPSGKPALRNMSWIASAHCGTFEACFSNPTLPAASAGAAKRNTCQNGKFHGMIARIGPIGW